VTNPRIHAIIVKYLWTISFLLVTVFLVFSVCPAGQFKVSRVTDGDTITVRDGSVEKIIRLVGIDAPEVSHKKRETGQAFSQQPTKYLAGLVLNQTVEINVDNARFIAVSYLWLSNGTNITDRRTNRFSSKEGS